MNSYLLQGQRYLVLSRSEDKLGRVFRLQPFLVLLNAIDFLVEVGHHLIDERLKLSDSVHVPRMIELPILRRVLHLLPPVVDKLICWIIPKHHAVVLGNLHLVARVGLPLFEVLAVSQHELGVILVAVLGLLDDLEEVLELPGFGEVVVVVDVDDDVLGVVLVVGH